MKFLFSTILSLLFTFPTLAQSQQSKKTRKIKASEEVAQPAKSADLNTTSVDTIHISKGKPTLLLINVLGQNTKGYKDTREEKELQNNFDKNKVQIINISRHSFIVFENNQTLDVSDFKNTYESKAFWNGKIKEQIQTESGLQKSTEFFAKQLKVKKESSYIINARKNKKEFESILKKNIVTDNSKTVMNTFLRIYSTPMIDEVCELKFFEQNISKVKTINVFLSEKKGKKNLFRSYEFNEAGQPLTLKLFKENGKLEGEIIFTYENGILKEITEGILVKKVSYNNDKMIVTSKKDNDEETKLFWVENNELFEKEFTLTNDDNLAYHNTIVETKFENNCKLTIYNDEVIKKECFSKKEEYPFIYEFISYQKDEVLQHYKVKLVKKNDNLYERFTSESNNAKEYKDNFKLSGSYQLNNKKQLSTIKFIKDKTEKTIKIEYNYFQ